MLSSLAKQGLFLYEIKQINGKSFERQRFVSKLFKYSSAHKFGSIKSSILKIIYSEFEYLNILSALNLINGKNAPTIPFEMLLSVHSSVI